jgi:hypothetical protein
VLNDFETNDLWARGNSCIVTSRSGKELLVAEGSTLVREVRLPFPPDDFIGEYSEFLCVEAFNIAVPDNGFYLLNDRYEVVDRLTATGYHSFASPTLYEDGSFADYFIPTVRTVIWSTAAAKVAKCSAMKGLSLQLTTDHSSLMIESS